MIRTVIALGDGERADAVCRALERRGVELRYRCRTGAETIRAVRKMGGGVVVCPFRLPDMTADTLADSIGDSASLLVLDKPSLLELIHSEELFRLAAPAQPSELFGAVNVLLQLDGMRARRTVPRRSAEDERAVARAKELLCSSLGMSESEAHKYLQRRSMSRGAKMEDTAKAIIDSFV